MNCFAGVVNTCAVIPVEPAMVLKSGACVSSEPHDFNVALSLPVKSAVEPD